MFEVVWLRSLGFRVESSGFGFRVKDLGFATGLRGSCFWVWGLGYRVVG